MLSLAHQVQLGAEADAVLNESLWADASGERGGRVTDERLHSTVLLRVNGAQEQQVLRTLAERTAPFSVRGGDMYLSRVARLSDEFGEEVYGLGVNIESEELLAFKGAFVAALAKATGDDEASLQATHDPYALKRKTAGHCSLAYIREDAVPRVRALLAELQGLGPQQINFEVRQLKLVMGKEHRTVPLGTFIPLEKRAVSVSYLRRWMAAHDVTSDPTMTTAQAVAAYIVPETTDSGMSQAATLAYTGEGNGVGDGAAAGAAGAGAGAGARAGERARAGAVDVGDVTHFVSHAWQSRVSHLLGAVLGHFARQHSEEEAATTFYWLDIFCANQHNLFGEDEIPVLWNVIRSAKSTVLVLHPWHQPITLSRAWCLYEILGTATLPNEHEHAKDAENAKAKRGELEVELPGEERAAFLASLEQDFGAVRGALSHIDSKNAKATNPKDLATIRQLIEEEVGFTELNALVKDELREWLLQAGLEHLESLAGGVDFEVANLGADEQRVVMHFAMQLGNMAGFAGRLELAARLYRNTMTQTELAFGSGHIAWICAGSDLGFVLGKTGKSEEAVALLREVLVAFDENVDKYADQEEFAESHVKTVVEGLSKPEDIAAGRRLLLQNNLAMTLGSLGPDHADEALELYAEVLEARRTLHAEHGRVNIFATINNMAWLLARGGDHARAEPLFREVLEFRQKSDGETSPGALNAAQNLSRTLAGLRYLDEACTLMRSVCSHKREQFGSSNRSTLDATLLLVEYLRRTDHVAEAKTWEDGFLEAVADKLVPDVADKWRAKLDAIVEKCAA